MNTWIDRLAESLDLGPQTVEHLIQSAVALMLFLLVRRVAFRVLRTKVTDVKRHYHLRKVVNYTSWFLLLVIIGGIWFAGLGQSATMIGLITAGVAVALQDPLTNIAGWAFLMMRRPYVVGDRIEIAGHVGDVIDITPFQTYLMECGNWVGADQSTGRLLAIPNGMVFKTGSANYTRGFEYIWEELPVLITFESNWKKAKQALIKIAETVAAPMSGDAHEQLRSAASKQLIFFTALTPIVYTNVQDSGVLLTLRYLTPVRQRRGNAMKVWEAILEVFGQNEDIDFAYPTVRYYRNFVEGKPGARAPLPGSPPVASGGGVPL